MFPGRMAHRAAPSWAVGLGRATLWVVLWPFRVSARILLALAGAAFCILAVFATVGGALLGALCLAMAAAVAFRVRRAVG